MYPKSRGVFFDFGGHFRQLSPKSRHPKIDCFSDHAFSTENRARGGQSRHHGRSGARKASNMELKMITFRGPAEKCEFEPLSFSLSRGVPESLRISGFFGRPFRRRIFDVRETQNGVRGGFRPILGRFWAPVWPYFRHFSPLFGGSEFGSIFDRFSDHFSGGPADCLGSAEAHSESADTESCVCFRRTPT